MEETEGRMEETEGEREELRKQREGGSKKIINLQCRTCILFDT